MYSEDCKDFFQKNLASPHQRQYCNCLLKLNITLNEFRKLGLASVREQLDDKSEWLDVTALKDQLHGFDFFISLPYKM